MRPRFTRNLIMLCICIIINYGAGAQDAARIYVEPDGWGIGTNFGLSDLWGNVGTKSFITHYGNSKYFDKVAFMGGMFGRYSIHPCLGVRLMMNYGTLYATDKWNYDAAKNASSEGDDAFQRYVRNQSAKANVFEGTVLFELLPFRFNPESKSASRRGQPVLELGVGVFHFTPYSTVGNSDNTWVKTYDLHLEGQGWGSDYPKQFNLWQPCIPMGIGYRWDIGQHLNIGVEYLFRYTFTKYLDGVSGKYVGAAAYAEHLTPQQAALAEAVADKTPYSVIASTNAPGSYRGNPGYTDKYSTISITFYYKVLTRSNKWWH